MLLRSMLPDDIWEYAINSEPTNVHDKKKSQHTAPDYWALHLTTGLCTQLLGFHPATGLCTRLLGFAPDCWALPPTTGLCARLLGFAPDDWALDPTTGLSPDYWAFTRISRFCLKPNGANMLQTNVHSNKSFPIEIPAGPFTRLLRCLPIPVLRVGASEKPDELTHDR